jgi:hypothetical protein
MGPLSWLHTDPCRLFRSVASLPGATLTVVAPCVLNSEPKIYFVVCDMGWDSFCTSPDWGTNYCKWFSKEGTPLVTYNSFTEFRGVCGVYARCTAVFTRWFWPWRRRPHTGCLADVLVSMRGRRSSFTACTSMEAVTRFCTCPSDSVDNLPQPFAGWILCLQSQPFSYLTAWWHFLVNFAQMESLSIPLLPISKATQLKLHAH